MRERLRIVILYSVVLLYLTGFALHWSASTHADVYPEGQVIVLPPNYKLVSIQMQGKKPMALVRLMREDEHPETWTLKPLDMMNADIDQLGAEPATIIRESSTTLQR